MKTNLKVIDSDQATNGGESMVRTSQLMYRSNYRGRLRQRESRCGKVGSGRVRYRFGGKTMPSSPGYHRNLTEEYKTQVERGDSGTGHGSKNAERHRARRVALKLGLVKRGQDLDHKKPLSKGGSNNPSNFRAESPHDNRSFPRRSNGSMIANHPKTK